MSDSDLLKFLLMASVAALEGNWQVAYSYLAVVWEPTRDRADR